MDGRKRTVVGMVGSPFLFFRASWYMVPEARKREGEGESSGGPTLSTPRGAVRIGVVCVFTGGCKYDQSRFFRSPTALPQTGLRGQYKREGKGEPPNNPDDYRTPWSRVTKHGWMNFVL